MCMKLTRKEAEKGWTETVIAAGVGVRMEKWPLHHI